MRKRDKMFLISFTIGIVLFGLFLAILMKEPVQEAPFGFKAFESKRFGYIVLYPEDWKRIPQNNLIPNNGQLLTALFVKPKLEDPDKTGIKPSINIVVDDLSMAPAVLDKYTETAIHQVRVVFKDQATVVESSPGNLGGKPAHKLIYTLNLGDKGTMKFLQIWTIHKKKGYQFTFASLDDEFDLYLPKAEKSIEEFALTK